MVLGLISDDLEPDGIVAQPKPTHLYHFLSYPVLHLYRSGGSVGRTPIHPDELLQYVLDDGHFHRISHLDRLCVGPGLRDDCSSSAVMTASGSGSVVGSGISAAGKADGRLGSGAGRASSMGQLVKGDLFLTSTHSIYLTKLPRGPSTGRHAFDRSLSPVWKKTQAVRIVHEARQIEKVLRVVLEGAIPLLLQEANT